MQGHADVNDHPRPAGLERLEGRPAERSSRGKVAQVAQGAGRARGLKSAGVSVGWRQQVQREALVQNNKGRARLKRELMNEHEMSR